MSARLLVALVALAAALLAGGCITRAAPPTPIDYPRAVAQLRALGVPAAYDDELVGELVALHCRRPAGATSAEVEPLLLRRLLGERPAEIADVALVQAVGILPAALCDPASGPPPSASPSVDPQLWSADLESLAADQAGLRANLPAAVGQFLGLVPTVDYAPGLLALEFTLEPGRDEEQLAIQACGLAQGLAGLFAFINVSPAMVALIAGDHDPRLRLAVVSGAASHILDSSPGRMSELIARCAAGG